MVLRRFTFTSVVSSGISGIIFLGFGNDPSVSAEWSSYVNLYEEHRVLATRFRFEPIEVNYTLSTSTRVHAAVVYSLNRNAGLTPPASIAAAFQKSNAIVRNTQQPFVYSTKAGSAQEMLFRATTAPGATWQLDMNADGVSVSTSYGVMFQEFLVQFRNAA